MGDLNELVEQLEREAERLSGYSIDRGSAEAGVAANLANSAADALTSLIAERDGLAEQVRVSDLEGNHAFALAVDDPGKNPPILWKDRALAAEAQLKAAREALEVAKEALAAADDRDQKARFRANSPRMDAEVIHLRTTALRTIRALSLDTNKGPTNDTLG